MPDTDCPLRTWTDRWSGFICIGRWGGPLLARGSTLAEALARLEANEKTVEPEAEEPSHETPEPPEPAKRKPAQPSLFDEQD